MACMPGSPLASRLVVSVEHAIALASPEFSQGTLFRASSTCHWPISFADAGCKPNATATLVTVCNHGPPLLKPELPQRAALTP